MGVFGDVYLTPGRYVKHSNVCSVCAVRIIVSNHEVPFLLFFFYRYVQRFISGGLTEKEQRAVGFPWSVEHRQRSLASTG